MTFFPGIISNTFPNYDILSRHHKNVQRMHTAVKLNEAIRENSNQAKLVVVNLPPVPKLKPGGNAELHCIL